MPSSHTDGKPLSMSWVKKLNPTTVLDVGAGVGTYAIEMKKSGIRPPRIDAIEVWQPYIDKYDLETMYDKVFKVDAREWDDWNYDLVILGDILEHMTKEEALAIWDKISKQASAAIISIPIIHCPQGHSDDNPYEEHIKEDWTSKEVLESFTGIVDHCDFPVVGVYLARF